VRRRRRRAGVAVALSTIALTAVTVRRSLLRVRGPSMRPTLRADDMVLTVPLPPLHDADPLHGPGWALRRRLLRPGGLVVLSAPGSRSHLIIKRITAVTPEGIEVIGDDPGWSIDSRTFGTVPHRDVRRLVLRRVWPPRSA